MGRYWFIEMHIEQFYKIFAIIGKEMRFVEIFEILVLLVSKSLFQLFSKLQPTWQTHFNTHNLTKSRNFIY